MAEPNITEEVFFQMLEKKADGSFKAKYPKLKTGYYFSDEFGAFPAQGVSLTLSRYGDLVHLDYIFVLLGNVEEDHLVATIPVGFRPEHSVVYTPIQAFATTSNNVARMSMAYIRNDGSVYIPGGFKSTTICSINTTYLCE